MPYNVCPHCSDMYPVGDTTHVCSQVSYAPKPQPKMNERIKELAEEAGMIIVNDEFSTYGRFAEKFAQLIVRECCDVLYDNEMGGYQVNYVLKEHFGVK